MEQPPLIDTSYKRYQIRESKNSDKMKNQTSYFKYPAPCCFLPVFSLIAVFFCNRVNKTIAIYCWSAQCCFSLANERASECTSEGMKIRMSLRMSIFMTKRVTSKQVNERTVCVIGANERASECTSEGMKTRTSLRVSVFMTKRVTSKQVNERMDLHSWSE
jgi:hypothetical protein